MVIDSNIFIEHLRKLDKSKSTLSNLPHGLSAFVSAITVFELFVGANTPIRFQETERILQNVKVLDFDFETGKIAGRLYDDLQRSGQKLEFRDVMIAATAIQHGLPLKTLNVKHFTRIPNLVLA